MKTNTNSYTIIYSAILVIVVAFLLAFVFQILKPMQDVNVALDQQRQILYSLNIRGLDDKAAAAKYKEVVIADRVIDENGKILEQGTQGGTQAGFKLNSADYKAGRLALYVCKVNGETKYVLPVYGMGLWGPINAFVALNDDKNTVYGAYFNHDSETAGLGAEIKDNLQWQQQFQGKKIFKPQTNEIGLAAVKKIDDPASQVDAVTGATLTSNGVNDMFKEGFGKYMKFLKEK
ncbi:NADH:ubiquinone reductase (Na(+)-transporting) subunit C [Hallella colorans]|uniref:NADH:ubiquinone reductase (Na(+)-transporting) subunit C n=1 Tax=Hallella colorans TaxID=1703337 RepID=UPI002889DAFF|nr:NADH:ubiquinone reductase (Na(+)-transporting) subunit C [Hallella colorans]